MVLEYCAFHAVPGRSDKVDWLGWLVGKTPNMPGWPALNRDEVGVGVLGQSGCGGWGWGAGAVARHTLALNQQHTFAHPHPMQERRKFDERYMRRDSSQLCDLTSAADGLEMRGLVDLGALLL